MSSLNKHCWHSNRKHMVLCIPVETPEHGFRKLLLYPGWILMDSGRILMDSGNLYLVVQIESTLCFLFRSDFDGFRRVPGKLMSSMILATCR
jgi:hypothetical protein